MSDPTGPQRIAGIDRRLAATLAGLVAFAGLWLGVLSPMLLGTDDSTDDSTEVAAAPAVTGSEVPDVADPATPSEDVTPPPPVDETFEVFTARDPFEQLVDDEAAATDVTGTTDPTATSGTTTPSDTSGTSGTPDTSGSGSSDTSGTGDTETTSGTPSATSETTEDGTTVVVEDVYDDDGLATVLLTANGTAHTLTEGDTFADAWTVEEIDAPCVTLLYRDQARQVCEGEAVRK